MTRFTYTAALVAMSLALAPAVYAAPKGKAQIAAAKKKAAKKKVAAAKAKALAKKKGKTPKSATASKRSPGTEVPSSFAATDPAATNGAAGAQLPGAQNATPSKSNMDALFGGAPPPGTAAPAGATGTTAAMPQVGEGDASTAEHEAEAEPEVDTTSGPSELAAVDIQAGAKLFSRNLAYSGDTAGALRGYKLGMAPAMALQLEWYPGAHFSNGLLSLVGITASYDRSIGIVSKITNDLVTYPTTSQSWSVGAQGRYQLGRFQPHVGASYGKQGFEIASVSATYQKPEVPNLDYTFLRGSVGTRIALPARFSINLTGGYIRVLNSGEMASAKYFPRATAGGLEANATLGYHLSSFEIRLGADMRRYSFNMNQQAGDALVATGATDQYVSGTLGVAFQR